MTAVKVTRSGAIETWTLNRPDRRNALDPRLVEELRDALHRAQQDGVRTVVLHGTGAGFCAGADLTYLHDCATSGRSPLPFLRTICDLTLEMEASPIIFLAALHGHAVAGGLELALSCDIVIAAAGTRIGDGHVRNALVPGGGASVRMARKLGPGAAAWLGLSGELVRACSLVPTGWLHAIVARDRMLDEAWTLAKTLSRQPSGAQRRYKSLLVGDLTATSEALDHELDIFEQNWAAEDLAGALGKFLGAEPSHNHGSSREPRDP
jgi:enoyl-CoA hydratase